MVANLFGANTESEIENHTIGTDFTSISINLSGAELEIKTGDKFDVETNHKYLKCEEKDDILKIPNDQQAYGMMAVNNPDETVNIASIEAEIRNNFKYYDPIRNPYNKNGQSYKDLANMKVPSGIIDKGKIQNTTGNIMVPYISEDGRTAVKIKNGRVYFGEDSGLNIASSDSIAQAANITSAIQKAINNTATKLSDSNCLYNGTNLADFVRSNFNQ